jgi:signal transduction histidine kinase
MAVGARAELRRGKGFTRRQNEFLVILVHELRNPLASIGGASSLLESTPNATPRLINIQDVISRQVKQMTGLASGSMWSATWCRCLTVK